jgi:hypothetical protein
MTDVDEDRAEVADELLSECEFRAYVAISDLRQTHLSSRWWS